jgi:hypothetical protein
MRHLRLRAGAHTLLFPIDAAASIDDGSAFVGKSIVRRHGLLVPVRDLAAEVGVEPSAPRIALHLERGDEQAVLLFSAAETIVDVDDSAWRPLPASHDALAPWVDALYTLPNEAPAFRLAVELVWQRFATGT